MSKPKPQFQQSNILLVEVPPQFIALCEASGASLQAALRGMAALFRRSVAVGLFDDSVYSSTGPHRLLATIMTAVPFLETSKVVGSSGVRLAVSIALTACLMSGCSSLPATQQSAFVPLVSHMAERVKTADQVALSKWDSGRPVHDPQREAEVIGKAVAAAPAYGLAAQEVEAFFMDQIEASKQVQHALLDLWKRSGSAPAWPRKSLSDEIRPQLDRLQIEIMKDLQQLRPQRQAADCEAEVARAVNHVTRLAAFDDVHRAALDRAVTRVCIED